jgi:hypothetical protein
MSEENHTAEKIHPPPERPAGWWSWGHSDSSGWWTEAPSQFPAENDTTSTNFFDEPPVLFQFLIWAFPYTYLYGSWLSLWSLASLFKACGARISDYIQLNSLAAFSWVAPLLFFIMLSIKGRWFRNNLFALLLVWFFLVLTSGLTQGAITSGLSKAYNTGN